ncbi:DsrH like protein [uncultured archaeon]|nr:DsrH like protein [uncultured archaeon]
MNPGGIECRNDEADNRTIFFLTKPPQSERARLCFQLIERSKNAALYLAGDGVYNLLATSIETLPQGSVHVCKEDMDARGVQSERPSVSSVDFYLLMVEDMMFGSDRVYTF